MKEYIKTLSIGVLTGAVIMQLTNMAIDNLIERKLQIGGEILLPALIGMVGYIGWLIAGSYFKATKYKEIYRHGFNEGVKVNRYKIIIPIEEKSEKQNKVV